MAPVDVTAIARAIPAVGLGPLALTTTLGQSSWRAVPAAATVAAAVAPIRSDPEITRRDRPDCIRCQDAIAGPLLDRRV